MKCKNCKQKFEVKYFNQKFCESLECLKAFAFYVKEKNVKRLRRETRIKKEELKTLTDHLKETQKVFNTFIRLRDAGKGCISCKRPLGQRYDAGHYWSTKYKSTTFSPKNVWGQCVQCNRDERGNLILYRENLITRIGPEALKQLDAEAREVKKWTRDELKDLQAYYKARIKEIKDLKK